MPQDFRRRARKMRDTLQGVGSAVASEAKTIAMRPEMSKEEQIDAPGPGPAPKPLTAKPPEDFYTGYGAYALRGKAGKRGNFYRKGPNKTSRQRKMKR